MRLLPVCMEKDRKRWVSCKEVLPGSQVTGTIANARSVVTFRPANRVGIREPDGHVSLSRRSDLETMMQHASSSCGAIVISSLKLDMASNLT